MPMYKCEWPNGDVSFVLASDVEDAISQLDELGDADASMIKRVREFMIDLTPNRQILEANERARKEGRGDLDWPWELAGFGESMYDPDAEIFPSDKATLRRLRAFDEAGEEAPRKRGGREELPAAAESHPER